MGGETLPYTRHLIDETDIEEVVEAMMSGWLTGGPCLDIFEQKFKDITGAEYALAVNSGTAALHAAMFALGVGNGDEVIVPAITFVATANAVVYQGGTPVIVDVGPDTLLVSLKDAEKKITDKTKAIIAVDYAGQPCDYDALTKLARKHGLYLVSDACHSLGARYNDRKVGTLADITCFSFHPSKLITTGEGGMVTTNNKKFYDKMKCFRNHGRQNGKMVYLGHNYRLSELHSALGSNQLEKMDGYLERRKEIAEMYDEAFKGTEIKPLKVNKNIEHAYHLYVVNVKQRNKVMKALESEGIGTQVHYLPVNLQPYYKRYNYKCPNAERVYKNILSLPMFSGMTDGDVRKVQKVVKKVVACYC